ncbi:hypothetical protein MLD38_003026 [Melastoma candidum]|uniref:Uncharacterized protein n=1 Tax=Melastoma candidum TaxID=119954 RepID=A0ACB9S107_9MYRT|nr:hypothetical protein MLD38_003026 [Melastoma candidum]
MANKVYNKKGKVHPSPPLPSSSTHPADHHLSLFLPAAIFALAASLPIHDKEVLSYFLSCSGSGSGCSIDLVGSRPSTRRRACHAPQFECGCFGCYVSFWSRWDSSNNRHVIDEIIEAFEEQERRAGAEQGRARQGRRGRREWKKRGGAEAEGDAGKGRVTRGEAAEAAAVGECGSSSCGEEEVGEVERGVVRRIGTTIGYKIWNFLDRITM